MQNDPILAILQEKKNFFLKVENFPPKWKNFHFSYLGSKGTEFDYEEIAKKIGSEKSYALGAGSGAMSCLEGHCGELIINENLITNESKSIIAQIDENKKCKSTSYNHRKHGGLGNIYYSEGKKGDVIKIKIKGRSGDMVSKSIEFLRKEGFHNL